MNKQPALSYQSSGVSIDAGDQFVERIKPLAKATHQAGVVGSLGGFAGLFQPDWKAYQNPQLVACTDGVGTKLKLALELKRFGTLGQDLVAMCVNDLICCGAKPLFFLDYLAVAQLDVEIAYEIMQGITRALQASSCSLLGGETAEMPGLYRPGDFDLAGFSVGIVDGDKIIDGSTIQRGDVLIGLTSSGFHSNGYSLIRKIIEQNKLDLLSNELGAELGLGKSLGEILLEPTKLYVQPVLDLLKTTPVKGMAHITGGGLVENVPRIIPEGLQPEFYFEKIPVPLVMKKFQELGPVDETEMWRVFNMGIGFVLVVSPELVESICGRFGHEACIIGKIV